MSPKIKDPIKLNKSPDRFAKFILPIIILSQFAGTSLWFAGNAVIAGLRAEFSFRDEVLGHVTSAVQLGFITGTLVFAFLAIADRFSPSKVFFYCATAGAISNALVAVIAENLLSLVLLRFITGFFLAGIYPVGMKIASDWHEKGLGKALGYLVGALVLGTAFPHLLRDIMHDLPWRYVFIFTSLFAFCGGLLLLFFVPDGPFRRKNQRPQLGAVSTIFKNKDFRAAAFGYFGHMWELYAFWAFLPVFLQTYSIKQIETNYSVSLLSFFIIASGSLSCVIGGHLSLQLGSKKVAMAALLFSGLCCLFSPLLYLLPASLFVFILFLWGMAVIADSPQFSTLVAKTAPKEYIGTALTICNCIGFFITVISIQLLNNLKEVIDSQYMFLLLIPGPVFGFIYSRTLAKAEGL